MFLIWSNEHGAWWRDNESGYTSHIDEAGRYTRADADRIVADATVDGQLWLPAGVELYGDARRYDGWC
jgi:hypothetical protein